MHQRHSCRCLSGFSLSVFPVSQLPRDAYSDSSAIGGHRALPLARRPLAAAARLVQLPCVSPIHMGWDSNHLVARTGCTSGQLH